MSPAMLQRLKTSQFWRNFEKRKNKWPMLRNALIRYNSSQRRRANSIAAVGSSELGAILAGWWLATRFAYVSQQAASKRGTWAWRIFSNYMREARCSEGPASHRPRPICIG